VRRGTAASVGEVPALSGRGWGPADHPLAWTAMVIGAVIVESRALPAARAGFPSDLPPMFLQWDPRVGPALGLAVVVGGFVCWMGPRVVQARRWVALGATVILCVGLSLSVAAIPGGVRTFTGCCRSGGFTTALTDPLERPTDYWVNVPLVDRLGLRRFDENYQWLARPQKGRLSLRAQTHPPGPVLLLWGLSHVTGGDLFLIALMVVALGAMAAIATYALTRELADERTARIAALLFATSPAVLLYVATAMDAILMALTAAAMAALVRAPRSWAWAMAGGALTILAATFTYAATALLPFVIGVFLVRRDQWRPRGIAGQIMAFGVGAVTVLAALRYGLGIDLITSFRVALRNQRSYHTFQARSYLYWSWANVVAFVAAGGLALTALAVRETVRRWRQRAPGLESVLWLTLIASTLPGLVRGETEHLWLVFVPLLAAAATPAVERLRWTTGSGIAQAVGTEALFFTNW
jgi:methylthioxylose transferase